MSKYYVSLGANLGDRENTLRRAVRMLAQTDGICVEAVSPLYETAPWGKTDQPPFINMAVTVETEMTGHELLKRCQDIERELGRIRHEKWGARTIDIDLVYSPDEVSRTNVLELPHPYLLARAFVLIPLRDIAPQLMIRGKNISRWIDALPDDGAVRKIDL